MSVHAEALCLQLCFGISSTPICTHRGQGIDLRERHGNEDVGKRSDPSQLGTDLELGPRRLAPRATLNNPRVLTHTTASNSRARPEAQHCLEGRGRGQVNTGLQLWVLGVQRATQKKADKDPWGHSRRGERMDNKYNWQIIYIVSLKVIGLPRGLSGKESAANAGDSGHSCSIPGSGRSSGKGNGNPRQYSCLENPHGQRTLVGHSPWGHKE